jgi:hypothetical protein
VVTGAEQPLDNAGAHAPEPDHSELHAFLSFHLSAR